MDCIWRGLWVVVIRIMFESRINYLWKIDSRSCECIGFLWKIYWKIMKRHIYTNITSNHWVKNPRIQKPLMKTKHYQICRRKLHTIKIKNNIFISCTLSRGKNTYIFSSHSSTPLPYINANRIFRYLFWKAANDTTMSEALPL